MKALRGIGVALLIGMFVIAPVRWGINRLVSDGEISDAWTDRDRRVVVQGCMSVGASRTACECAAAGLEATYGRRAVQEMDRTFEETGSYSDRDERIIARIVGECAE